MSIYKNQLLIFSDFMELLEIANSYYKKIKENTFRLAVILFVMDALCYEKKDVLSDYELEGKTA